MNTFNHFLVIRPGLGPQKGQVVLQQSSVPLAITLCFPSQGSEAWRQPVAPWICLRNFRRKAFGASSGV